MTTYAPDLAPELNPRVVRWLPAHRTGEKGDHGGYLSWTGLAVALVAAGAVAATAVVVVGLVEQRRPRYRLLESPRRFRRLGFKRRPF